MSRICFRREGGFIHPLFMFVAVREALWRAITRAHVKESSRGLKVFLKVTAGFFRRLVFVFFVGGHHKTLCIVPDQIEMIALLV